MEKKKAPGTIQRDRGQCQIVHQTSGQNKPGTVWYWEELDQLNSRKPKTRRESSDFCQSSQSNRTWNR